MSGSGEVDYPDELKLAHWEKKKGSLPDKNDVADLLKALQKKHGAVAWAPFDPGWVKAAKTADELDEAFATRDRQWRSSVFALKKDANAVATAAQKMGKDKAAGKPVQEAAKAIASAVDKYCSAIDDGADALKRLADKARGSLPSGDADEDDEDGPAWMEPKRLLQQLNLCKKDNQRNVQFAFVDKSDKAPGVLVLSPKQAGRSIFAKLQKETGVKTGAYGTTWMDGTQLMLQLDKPLGGLVKKLREPVKACGFRVTKIVLWNADGTVFEEEAEDTADPNAPGGGTAPVQPPADAAALFNARLKALLPRVQAAAGQPAGQEAKLLLSEAGVFARKQDFAKANALLDQAEAKLGPAAPPPKAASAPSVVFTQSRLAWDKTRKLVQAELRKLELAVQDQSRDEPDYETIAANTRVIYQVLDFLDERLIDKLDEALNATLEDERRARQDEAREIIDEYLDYIRTDELLQAVDDNGFIDVAIVSSLNACLTTVGKQLRA